MGIPGEPSGFVHRFVPGQGPHTLLFLHGTGGDENDLLGLGRPLAPGAALLSPRGKVVEGGLSRYFRRLAEGVFDLADLQARTHELADFVEAAVQRYRLASDRVMAVGFSNGANIAASVLLLRPQVLAGAILFRAMDEGRIAVEELSVQNRQSIAALLADVDGTLVTKEKVLTDRAIEAVRRLHQRGITFAITSGRPPRGMRMLVEPLRLTLPIAAFNGGMMVHPDLSVIDEHALPDDLVPVVIDTLQEHRLDVWIYRATEWYVRSPGAPHVDREAATVQFPPTVASTFDGLLSRVVKVVGVSDDLQAVAGCEAAAQELYGTRVSAARSQPYYLDVTHPMANKGTVIERLSRFLRIPQERIATIGDQPNDVLMFRRSGLSIAMGNASEDVQRQAAFVTTSCDDEGFANAVERFILGRAAPVVASPRTE